ncbi:MAG: tetratricopeptide repeat protein [Hyphomicrobiaceae bacterium]|nr:tetratricopeptide repeat protein [Hyphomicrobiaceae bacterium]
MSALVMSSLRGAALAAATAVAGCTGGAGIGAVGDLTTGSVKPASVASYASEGEAGATAVTAHAARKTSPSALETARALRVKGDRAKALAELERVRRERPNDREIARETGLVALELGQLDKAVSALAAAHDPAKPDHRTLSALGTAHASSGNQKEAQAYFQQALALKPDHHATLNNLALSYALEGDLAKAERMLKAASTGTSSARVKENLALVLALAGKYDDAEQLAANVMPKAQVAANMVYLKSLKRTGG